MTDPSVVAAAIVGAIAAIVVACFVFVRSKRKEIALLVVVVALSATGAEIALRLLHPTIAEEERMFAPDPELGWTFIPNKRGLILYPGEARLTVQTNSEGFRDRETDPGAARRILVVGDSFVTNISVALDDVFTEVMERRLDGTAVLNRGVNGYGQAQEYLLLKEQIDSVDADLVVVVIYVRNDFDDNLGAHWIYPRPYIAWNGERAEFEFQSPAAPAEVRTRLPGILGFYARSHVYRLYVNGVTLAMQRAGVDHRPTSQTPPELYLCRRDPAEDTRRMFAAMEFMLVRIADLAASKGVPLVFAVAPSFLQVDDEQWASALAKFGERGGDFALAAPNDSLVAMAARHGFAMVDLLPALRAATAQGAVLYNPQEQHWNREGNALVAQTLLEFLSGGPN